MIGEDLVWSLSKRSRAVFVLTDSKSEVWEKSEPLVWRIQISEEIRIQDSVQFTGTYKVSKTKLTGLESNREKGTNINFLSTIIPIFYPR